MATAMRLTFTIIFLFHFSHGLPIQADTGVTSIIDKLIGDKKWDDLCILQGQIASLALEMNHENRAMFEATLEYMEVNLDEIKDYDCPIPVIATVVTTSTTTEALPIFDYDDDENENFNSTETGDERRMKLCDDCGIDYNEIDPNREDFEEAINENPNQTTTSLKTILLYATAGVLGLIMVCLFIFFCVKMCRSS